MRLIDADVLLEKVREIRKLALDRAVETPANMPFPIYQNPAYTRYSTQADEREKFKVMIEEAPSVQPERKDAIEKAVAVEAISDELMSRFDISATYAYDVAESAVNRIEVMAKKMYRGEDG